MILLFFKTLGLIALAILYIIIVMYIMVCIFFKDSNL